MSDDPVRSSPRRREILDELRRGAGPLGVTEVAERLGVHPNTVRFHLDALVTQGAVEATVARPAGPGRPRTVYAARPGMDRGGVRQYRLLARILLGQLSSTGPGAAAAATEAGRAWGSHLVEREPPSRTPTVRGATDRLVAMLDDLGFEPRAGDDQRRRVRLEHCPFLELAEEFGPVVCPLHLGLMRGALEELDAPVTATRLEPFAEPGACVAHLETR